MSQYDETNPHFWPTQPSDFAAPPLIRPEPRQHWDGNLYRPDQDQRRDPIQVRTRQRQQPQPHLQQPGSSVHPPNSPFEHGHQRPSTPPRHHRPSTPPRHHQPSTPPRHHQPSTPPRHHRSSTPPNQQRPASHPHPVEVPGQTRPTSHSHPVEAPAQTRPKAKHPSSRPHVSFEQGAASSNYRENLMYPTPNRTKPVTWFGAVFCVILWLVIILGGLLVLIIYLVYRPRTPHFEISTATLNAAYLDMGYLLNSDITVLTNFTNPNKKVNVDFSYVTLQIYFDKHLIATHYIEPFSIYKTESKLANVEFITSQVRLPLRVTQQLITQVQRNRVTFEVDGSFHARSNFGSLLRYSYWLYGHCQIEVTGPPSGVMLTSHCKTKD
ncbi:NDR1/HIN1-like protein 6 [Amaranthus tricolor]|uniref:NDR1/HIN1-like protein 6 n=1 Tax=Amaranthus tricolor TaxID=29722 RepID=UPI00258349B4|nr:NDR1/HIN1-like protein 6 [Amaranthus tricolor]